MTNQDHNILPLWFVAPTPREICQRSLFSRPTSEVLLELRVSLDECARWYEKGWLSWEVKDLLEVDAHDEPKIWEVGVVRDIVRSGLGDIQIEALLNRLPKPFAMNPEQLAFSFRYGWVEPAFPGDPDPEEIIDEHIEAWLEARDAEALRNLRDQIDALLAAAADTGREEEA